MWQRLVVAPEQWQEGGICLSPEQQHYLQRVLRLQQGDRFIAMDGRGHSWLAQLDLGNLSPLRARLIEPLKIQTELPIAVTLMAALPKGNGFDEVVRQATELGVTGIVPLISDRTLLHPSAQKLERWRRIMQEAAEQSERQMVPTLLEPRSFAEGLTLAQASPAVCYLGVTHQTAPHLLTELLSHRQAIAAVTVCIGPEGGWTEAEVAQAIAAGLQPVSLGRRILRSVTAPLAVIALIAAVWEWDGTPCSTDPGGEEGDVYRSHA